MLNASRVFLRAVELADLNATYLGWLNDPEVNHYLETRYLPQTMESLRRYWETHRDDPSSPWFAICLETNGQHIGNIKLGPIDWMHRRSDISLFIGDRSCWGHGFASEAITSLRDWAFHELDLQKLSACIYEGNIGSLRAFEKSGFKLEGTYRYECFHRGKRVDIWRMGFPRADWEAVS